MGLNVGLIGLDGHQGEILHGIPMVAGARLAAVASANAARLDAMRRHADDPKTRFYSDYREMLARESLDVVGVCNINGERAAVLLECAAAGVNIIAEKPLVTTLEDLARVQEAVTRAGVRLTMMLTMRYSPVYQRMRQLVADGRVGEPVQADAQKSYKLGERPDWMKRRESFGGTIPFVGIHGLDLIRWTTGQELVAGAAMHSNVGMPQVGQMEDNAGVVCRMANGGTATMRIDYLRPPSALTHGDDRLRIAGAEGIAEVAGQGTRLVLMTRDSGPEEVTDLPPAGNILVDFAAALGGEREPLIPETDVYRMTEVVLRLRDAADEGRTASLMA